jgi:hypothetical protein
MSLVLCKQRAGGGDGLRSGLTKKEGPLGVIIDRAPLRLISGLGLYVSARAASGHRRESMAPILVAGASRVFTSGCLSFFEVRADGS